MTIILKNQYVCKLDVGDFKDFVQMPDLISLIYVEDSAMTLPHIEIDFIVRDKEVINYLNEGNILTVGLGKNELSMLDLRFRITSNFANKKPSVGDRVVITGIHDDYEFSNKNLKISYNDMSSLDVVKTVAKKHFPIFKTNLDKTNDIQNWQQHENSWTFLRNVCNQGYYNSNTFLVSAFDNDTFYYYDFRKKLESAVRNQSDLWIFSKNGSGERIITYNTSHVVESSGATSRVLGYRPIMVEYGWLDYSVKAYTSNTLGFTSIDTSKKPILDNITSTVYKNLGTNNYNNSNIALTQNARNMILNANVLIFISCGGQFKQLKLLDTVLIDNSGDSRIVGFSTIAKIAYQIMDNQLYTNITLVRESLNSIRGDLQ